MKNPLRQQQIAHLVTLSQSDNDLRYYLDASLEGLQERLEENATISLRFLLQVRSEKEFNAKELESFYPDTTPLPEGYSSLWCASPQEIADEFHQYLKGWPWEDALEILAGSDDPKKIQEFIDYAGHLF